MDGGASEARKAAEGLITGSFAVRVEPGDGFGGEGERIRVADSAMNYGYRSTG
jgi:hypothetical protein